MSHKLTVQEICKATGKSEYWLRNHTCGLCEQVALEACRGQCSNLVNDKCTSQQVIERLHL